MAKSLAEIAAQLEEPFALADIDFLPKGQFEKDGKQMVMGLPYADPRVYQDRLNAVCPGDWSTQANVTVAGTKILTLVTVTICGVAHTDIGEASLDGPTKENAGTESFAQGFKRACSQVGLGRYLYALDKAYLPYNKQYKKIDLDANGLRNEVRKLYAKAGLTSQRANEQPAQPTTSAAPTRTQPTRPAPAAKPEQAKTTPEREFEPVGSTETALNNMYAACTKFAGMDKGSQLFAHIKKTIVGEKRDIAIVNEDLIKMWASVREYEAKYEAAKKAKAAKQAALAS